jgi:4-diphosphocytidyl-2-C-methyl-D-erythritol kinase
MKSAFKTQGILRVRSPAKVTPWLHVLGRRGDGFHEVRLGLVPVSLYDILEFRPAGDQAFALTVEGAEPIGAVRDNLVWRAAEAFQRESERPLAVAIHLIKSIPSGAGLGGGSGNAAATLLALNRLGPRPLSREALLRLAGELGSDVPFFLDPRPSLAMGRGEWLRPLEGFPALPLLIVKPAFSIPTAEAYARVRPAERALAEPAPRTLEALLELLENDFEPALFPVFPELAAIKARLLEAGAAGALLSGTGSALFGLFPDIPSRERAMRELASEREWRLFSCEMSLRHDYGLGGADQG